MKNLVNCGTCGYPLTPEERTTLVEKDGVMVKPAPVQEPVAWCTKSELENMAKGFSQDVPARAMRVSQLFLPEGSTVLLYTTPPAQPAPVQEPVNQRAHEMALRQWESWKQYALELQEKLVKYEGGAPMVLNTTPQPRIEHEPENEPWVSMHSKPIPVQKPVAWCSQCGHKCPQTVNQEPVGWWDAKLGFFEEKHFDQLHPVYTTPPAQPTPVPLTEQQKQELAENWFAEDWAITKAIGMMYDHETKLKEKNT